MKTFNFSYEELVIDRSELVKLLGFENEELPEPFSEYLEIALEKAASLSRASAVYRVTDKVMLEKNASLIMAEDIPFHVGKMISRELQGSEKLAFFICTAGSAISEISARLLQGENPVLGYVYDLLGSAIVEAAGDKMQEFLKKEMALSGNNITNRYSPGYCKWSVAEQHKLFSLFGANTCGVSLTSSALMHPVKSISGVIGIGPVVHYREYQCELCKQKDCVYRRLRV